MSTQDKFRDGIKNADGSHPESWIPDPGETLIGELQRYDSARTVHGEADIAVIADEDDDGTPRSFWLIHTVAIQEFAKLAPKPGERVAIKRLEDGDGSNGAYRRFVIRVDREADETAVPDFAKRLPPEMRRETEEPELVAETVPLTEPDDDLPF